MADRYRMSWTPATIRWWRQLGHIDGCACPDLSPDGGQRTVEAETYRSIFRCWHSAVANISERTTPRGGVHATRAMYAFRDRATRPLSPKEAP